MGHAMRKVLLTGLVAALAFAGGAMGQDTDATTASFGLADIDGSGTIDSEEYRYRMVQIFAVLDENDDGYLVIAEVPDDNKALFAVVDTDGNERVSLKEYLVFVAPRFWKADYDGDNVLSLTEVQAADKLEAEAL